MNIEQLKQSIVAAYPARQPLMLWGPPGVGKSSGVKQAAEALKVDLIDLRLGTLDPTDLRGLPSIDKGVAKWSRPAFLPSSGKGLLFLDEFVQAPPSMMASASQLILDRRIGEYILPDGWHVIAAGNRLSDRASTNAMPTHIANRFVHLYAEVDLKAWVHWALGAGVDIRVIAFIKFRQNLLHVFDAQARALAFPTPRAWEFVSNLLKTGKLSPEILPAMINGSVGEGAGAEFVGFLRVFEKMPDIDGILLNPKTAPLPTDSPATLYAVTSALSARATPDNMGPIATYFTRISDAGKPEFSVAAMREISARDDIPGKQQGKMKQTRAFIEWASAHNHILV
jgi:hypothetical protein